MTSNGCVGCVYKLYRGYQNTGYGTFSWLTKLPKALSRHYVILYKAIKNICIYKMVKNMKERIAELESTISSLTIINGSAPAAALSIEERIKRLEGSVSEYKGRLDDIKDHLKHNNEMMYMLRKYVDNLHYMMELQKTADTKQPQPNPESTDRVKVETTTEQSTNIEAPEASQSKQHHTVPRRRSAF